MLQLRFTNANKAPIWLVAPKYSFGTNHDNDCILTDKGIAPIHAEIIVAGEAVSLIRKAADELIMVNNTIIESETLLYAGDQIVFGGIQINLVDPKHENPQARTQGNDKTHLRSSASSDKAEWFLRPLNTTLIAGDGFALLGTMTLGRAKECDISIPASHLSRKHAKFSVISGSLMVEDLASSNGTFVNGVQRDSITLKHGDEVSFDTLKFRVESARNIDAATTIRAALDETQIRNAVTPEQLKSSRPATPRKAALPVRPKQSAAQSSNASGSSDALVLVLGIFFVVAFIAAVSWYLLT